MVYRARYAQELEALATKKVVALSELESAVGRCIHAAAVAPEGKADLENLYRCIHALSSSTKRRFVSESARAELRKWAARLKCETKVPLFSIHSAPPENDPTTLTIRVDASLREEGGAGGFGWWSADTSDGTLHIHYGLDDWTEAESSQFSSASAELWAMRIAVASALEGGALKPAHKAVLVVTDSEAAWGAILHSTRSSSQMEACKEA